MSAGRRRGTLSEEDRRAWQAVARAVKPLPRGRSDEVRPLAETSSPAKTPKIAPALVPRPRLAPAASTPPLASLDRREKQRLARGREPIEARIDLHGLTLAQAHAALARFLRAARADGAKFVLVITGKGAHEGERGVLRRQVPQWLRSSEFGELVVGFEAAHVRHGGEGALYVRLRRAR